MFTGNWVYLHWFLCGDKCNSKFIHYFWLLGSSKTIEDKAREKGLVNVYISQQPITLSKTGRFQRDERKDTKDYIKVSLV